MSSLLVYIVMGIAERGENPRWIPNNLNVGHLDRFYFLVAALTALDFVLYVLCACWYKSINIENAVHGKLVRPGARDLERSGCRHLHSILCLHLRTLSFLS